MGEKEIKDKLLLHEKALVSLSQSIKENKRNLSDNEELLKKFKKDIETMNVLIRELSESGGAGGSVQTAQIDDEQIRLMVRAAILEDGEILELLQRVFENITTYNHNKDKVNGYVAMRQTKKKRGKGIGIFGAVAAVAASIIIVVYIFAGGNNGATLTIDQNQIFFDASTGAEQTVSRQIDVKIVDEDERKYYFEINGKRYYLRKI